MRKSNLFPIICYIFVMALLSACGSDVDITMPKGPKGDSGLSAYEFWKEQVTNGTLEWPKDKVGVADKQKLGSGLLGFPDRTRRTNASCGHKWQLVHR
ncbi:hypothetical protein [Bacteroides graminisolvens]